MKLREEKKFYRFQHLFLRIRHGLLFLTLRNILVKFGLDIGIYFWVLEGTGTILPPTIKGNTEDYDFIFLSHNDIKSLGNLHFLNPDSLIKRNGNGMKVVGLKNRNGQVAAFMFIEYENFGYEKRNFRLEEGEVYLSNMYTYQDFRGQNLAPYLRHKSYEILKKEGVTRIYSITDYFNKSSQKFKQKLKSKNLYLFFNMILFKKYHKTFKIKEY
ncbi:GNAT family N-acetyltransferase [Flagellimonas sp. S174]|uniref:GNAT family N-acetyltransferase n=1 Tax=Flagellimonas sp. S174 TaxID=3410790 RepID=UPI00262AE23F|nr:GNAT family N-acetyltransferase [uncultured Allomuricauda sp.]